MSDADYEQFLVEGAAAVGCPEDVADPGAALKEAMTAWVISAVGTNQLNLHFCLPSSDLVECLTLDAVHGTLPENVPRRTFEARLRQAMRLLADLDQQAAGRKLPSLWQRACTFPPPLPPPLPPPPPPPPHPPPLLSFLPCRLCS